MKRKLFAIHSWLGLCLGLVLAVMGATGAMMSFEDEISRAIDSGYFAPGIPAGPDLSPDALVARVEAGHPGYYVDRLDWEMDRARSHAVRMRAIGNGVHIRGRISGRVARDSGALLAEPGVVRFFATVRTVHRWLALPGNGDGWGRIVTGFGATALIGFVVTGLALRWPRTARQWRRLLKFDLKPRKGRLRVLHRVTGTWVLPLYLLSALTGLWWTSETYQDVVRLALTGKGERSQRIPRKPVPWHADGGWQAFEGSKGAAYAWARITMQPAKGDKPATVRIESRPADARHAKVIDTYRYIAKDGSLASRKTYGEESVGEAIAGSMLEVHRGAFFGVAGRFVVLFSSMLLPFFAFTGLWFWWTRKRNNSRLQKLRRST